MSHYEVEVRDARGDVLTVRHVQCHREGDAVALAGVRGYDRCTASVYRRTRRGRRKLRLVAVIGGPDGDGLAGVREPRRPLPDPGHLAAERA